MGSRGMVDRCPDGDFPRLSVGVRLRLPVAWRSEASSRVMPTTAPASASDPTAQFTKGLSHRPHHQSGTGWVASAHGDVVPGLMPET